MSELYCKWVNSKSDPIEYKEGFVFYEKHPLLAVIFKKYHERESCRKLYQIRPKGNVIESWSQYKSEGITFLKKIRPPKINTIQRIAFGVLCTLEIFKKDLVKEYKDASVYVDWAEKWLSGEDRSSNLWWYVFYITADVHAHYSMESLNAYRNGYNADAAKYDTYSSCANAAGLCVSAFCHYEINWKSPGALNSASRACVSAAKAISSRPNIDLISIAEKAMDIKL